MSQTATCEYCSEIFEISREYCPKCGKQIPREIKATLVVEQFAPDCSRCHAFCCRALAFDWPHYKKLAGEPCKHLTDDFKCGNWENLEQDGFTECRSYDCYGAGQTVAKFMEEQHPDTWRSDAQIQRAEMLVFQQVYAELYADIHKRAPEIGDKSKIGADNDRQ
jgi:hypothetical protein